MVRGAATKKLTSDIRRALLGRGLTDFQIKVLEATAAIPIGRTATYGEIAMLVGRPRASRAVGTALKRNPFPVIIPCHRVVRKDGIGNYSNGGPAAKLRLLIKEKAIKKD